MTCAISAVCGSYEVGEGSPFYGPPRVKKTAPYK